QVASEASRGVSSWPRRLLSWRLLSWRFLAPIGAAMLLIVAISLSRATSGPSVSSEPPFSGIAARQVDANAGADSSLIADEPSLNLVADLASDLDWDAAVEAGLSAPPVSVDRALADLSDGERVELQRLLRQELTGSGA